MVDDNEVYRLGMVAALTQHPQIEVVAACAHAEALGFDPTVWDEVDVALVDLADVRDQLDDQFPGIRVIEAIRRCRTSNQTTVVAYTFHVVSSAARRRAKEADADFFYDREELSRTEVLHQVVLAPDAGRRGVPPPLDPEELRRLGVGPGTRVNAGADAEEWRALGDQRRLGAHARQRARARWNRRVGLAVRNRDGSAPERAQTTPSWGQLESFYRWATRAGGRRDS